MNEKTACIPVSLNPNGFNPDCVLPYELTTEHIRNAMQDFLDFFGFHQLAARHKRNAAHGVIPYAC